MPGASNFGQGEFAKKLLKGSMLIGIASFVFAVVLGVWRIALTRGFVLPSIPEILPPHGNVMVGAFLGTLIIFERMFALPIKWLVWVPYAWGLSALTIHLDFIGFKILNLIALLGWGVHRFIAYKTFKNFFNPLVEFIAYIALSTALFHENGLARSVESALSGLSFAIAVIGVERIELTLSSQRKSAKLVYVSLIIYLLLSILNSLFYIIPLQAIGIALFLVGLGLIYNDSVIIMAFKGAGFGITKTPLHKFSRQTLMVAYVWLLFSAISITFWELIQSVAKDVVFHSIGLGFIFTMILSHAPVVLGSTLAKMPKRAPSIILFYLFQVMTAVRILADLLVSNFIELWIWSGWITGTLHFVIFVFYMLSVVRSFK